MCEIDLLTISRGSVVAPAGCGKTHLITQALKRWAGDKPVLVLTHTNAGVAALRRRLSAMGVPRTSYRLATLDGWALRLVSYFPMRSGYQQNAPSVADPKKLYPSIRQQAVGLVGGRHIDDLLRASYSRVIVDEYQDCSVQQHQLVVHLARVLPTCVLGDPLQAIFGFGDDPLPDWQTDVLSTFPVVGTLSTPLRWERHGQHELGQWLLSARDRLIAGQGVDLRTAPKSVRWMKLTDEDSYEVILRAAYTKSPGPSDSVLIIADSNKDALRHKIASRARATVVEPVDLGDLLRFAGKFDLGKLTGLAALERLLAFAENVMTKVSSLHLTKRLDTIRRGKSRKPVTVKESLALQFIEAPSYGLAAQLLRQMSRESGVWVYRPLILRALIDSLILCDQGAYPSLYEAATRVRERLRHMERELPPRAVGSTLLVKGLESDVAVVLNAHQLDRRNLYVALTRGSKQLIVCSPTPILNPEQ